MQKFALKNIEKSKKKITEDLQVLLILDVGYSALLLIAFTHGYWDSFFGGLAGGLFFNFLFFREYYLHRIDLSGKK